MIWLGDYPEDFTTVTCMFTTHDGNGAPVAPLTAFENADVRIYKNGSATEKTSQNGVTMTSPFDSIVGLHCLVIDTSNDTGDSGFWTTGGGDVFTLVLSPDTETVNGQTVAKVIGQFGIELSSALRPTTARRKLDVSATGEAGLDFDNIKDATGAHTLTNITVPIVTTVTNQLTAAAIATGVWQDTTAGDFTAANSVGKSVMNGVALGTGLTVNAVTTVNGLAANVITAAATHSDFGTEIAAAVWQDAVAGDFTVAGSIGKSVMNGIALGTGLTIVSVSGSVGSVTGLTASDVGTIKTKTDFLPSATAGAAGGVFIAGTNAATTITTGLTTHFIGTVDTVTTYTGNTPQTGDNYALANGLNGFVAIKGDTAAIKLKTDNLPSDPADASDIASAFSTVNTTLATLPSAATIAAAVWAYTVEGTYTAVQYLRGFAATLFWKSAGQATANPTFRDAADLKNRIDGTADADGNRSAVTVDLS